MKKEFAYGLIIGAIITILLIASMEYARQTRPKRPTIETARTYGCMTLARQNCDASTDSITLENFDSNKDGKIDGNDTLFELCKNYFEAETESKCKIICGCSICSQDNSLSCDRTCNSDDDCELSCGCGCISKSEECRYAGIVCEAPGPYEECKCINNECKYFNPPP